MRTGSSPTRCISRPSFTFSTRKHRDGAEVVVIPSKDGVCVDTQRVVDAIDERTAIVSLSHVLFKSAYVHDVAAITERRGASRRSASSTATRPWVRSPLTSGRSGSTSTSADASSGSAAARARRSSGSIPTSAAGSSRGSPAGCRTSNRSPSTGSSCAATMPGASSTGRPVSRPCMRPGRAWKSFAGSGSTHPRQVLAANGSPAGTGRPAGIPLHDSTRSGAAGWDGGDRRGERL